MNKPGCACFACGVNSLNVRLESSCHSCEYHMMSLVTRMRGWGQHPEHQRKSTGQILEVRSDWGGLDVSRGGTEEDLRGDKKVAGVGGDDQGEEKEEEGSLWRPLGGGQLEEEHSSIGLSNSSWILVFQSWFIICSVLCLSEDVFSAKTEVVWD